MRTAINRTTMIVFNSMVLTTLVKGWNLNTDEA
jgi:hypothetical protein